MFTTIMLIKFSTHYVLLLWKQESCINYGLQSLKKIYSALSRGHRYKSASCAIQKLNQNSFICREKNLNTTVWKWVKQWITADTFVGIHAFIMSMFHKVCLRVSLHPKSRYTMYTHFYFLQSRVLGCNTRSPYLTFSFTCSSHSVPHLLYTQSIVRKTHLILTFHSL